MERAEPASEPGFSWLATSGPTGLCLCDPGPVRGAGHQPGIQPGEVLRTTPEARQTFERVGVEGRAGEQRNEPDHRPNLDARCFAARQAQQVVADRAKKQAEQERAERMANNMAATDRAQNEMAAADAAQSAAAGKTEAPKPASAPQAPPPLTPERQYFLKEVKARIDASLAA